MGTLLFTIANVKIDVIGRYYNKVATRLVYMAIYMAYQILRSEVYNMVTTVVLKQ